MNQCTVMLWCYTATLCWSSVHTITCGAGLVACRMWIYVSYMSHFISSVNWWLYRNRARYCLKMFDNSALTILSLIQWRNIKKWREYKSNFLYNKTSLTSVSFCHNTLIWHYNAAPYQNFTWKYNNSKILKIMI